MITTRRAYDELEKDGFIYTIAAKGCFVNIITVGLCVGKAGGSDCDSCGDWFICLVMADYGKDF